MDPTYHLASSPRRLNLDSPHFARDLRAALDATPRAREMFPPAPVRGPWIREQDYRRGAVSGPFASVPRGERAWLIGLVLLAAVVAVRVIVGVLSWW